MLAPDYLVCIRCRQPIDKQLPWPHLMSKTVDHIRDLADGGDPLDPANLGPAHLTCNSSAGARGKAARRARQDRTSLWVREVDP